MGHLQAAYQVLDTPIRLDVPLPVEPVERRGLAPPRQVWQGPRCNLREQVQPDVLHLRCLSR